MQENRLKPNPKWRPARFWELRWTPKRGFWTERRLRKTWKR